MNEQTSLGAGASCPAGAQAAVALHLRDVDGLSRKMNPGRVGGRRRRNQTNRASNE